MSFCPRFLLYYPQKVACDELRIGAGRLDDYLNSLPKEPEPPKVEEVGGERPLVMRGSRFIDGIIAMCRRRLFLSLLFLSRTLLYNMVPFMFPSLLFLFIRLGD